MPRSSTTTTTTTTAVSTTILLLFSHHKHHQSHHHQHRRTIISPHLLHRHHQPSFPSNPNSLSVTLIAARLKTTIDHTTSSSIYRLGFSRMIVIVIVYPNSTIPVSIPGPMCGIHLGFRLKAGRLGLTLLLIWITSLVTGGLITIQCPRIEQWISLGMIRKVVLGLEMISVMGFCRIRKKRLYGAEAMAMMAVAGHFVLSPPARNFAFGTNTSREFAKNLGNYDGRYGSEIDGELFRNGRGDGVGENHRWVHSRQSPRDVPNSSVERGIDEFSDGDGVRVTSGKWVPHVSEMGRFNNRGSRESNHEYDRTPRKQVQKKSAFLRIQMGKPNYRNKSDEQSLPYGYYDDASSSSPFRGKDPLVYSDHRVEDEEREGSPVELDVSFKSNSLVAKAIVAPSSPLVGSDRNLTPRIRNIRKLPVIDMDNSSSHLTKDSDGPVKLDSSAQFSSNPSTSVEDTKQSEEKVTVSGSGTTPDVCSMPCSNGTNVSLGKRTVERSHKGTVLNKGGTNVGSDGKSLPKVMKKKKVVKKVMTPISRLSSSQPAKKHDRTCKSR
ncbi:hypothetical protein L1049_025449 [Liquidambar formosana]|uniref:Uncharacterized protein n=1 Tax=Liquidambar formosana TaxID=63359 RepID=A0AAP0NCU3_LIQFO